MGTKRGASPLSALDSSKKPNMELNGDTSGGKTEESATVKMLLDTKLELQDNIGTLSAKMGNMHVTNAAVRGSINFHGDYLESLSTRLTESEDVKRIGIVKY